MTSNSHNGLRDAVSKGVERGGNVVVVTGAGISAASGLRTYRGEGGLWTEEGSAAMAKATSAYFIRKPEMSWAWHLARRSEALGASPNAAHHAIADLEAILGNRMTLVTQNIDRLHLRTGSTSQRTIEVHGHVDGMRCTAGCEGIDPIPAEFDDWMGGDEIGDEHRELLVYSKCGFVTRPHVLWFDEFYDERHFRMQSAGRAAAHASLCITVGTSGGVPLATRLAGIAAKAQAVLIDINPLDNALRHLARESGGTFVDRMAGDVLPAISEIIDRLEQTPRDADEHPMTGLVGPLHSPPRDAEMDTAEKRDAPSTDRGLRAAAQYRRVPTDMMAGSSTPCRGEI